MTDHLIERLTSVPDTVPHLESIPWPSGSEPKPIRYNAAPGDSLPQVDIVALTYTAAEAMAMADVLTPGVQKTSWIRYAKDWTTYEPELTGRSPARYAECMGEYCLTEIAGKRVLCFHSELHLATDSTSLPLARLFQQIIEETGCSLFVDTGTAGGIGPDVVEGDTVVGQNLMFDCTGAFKDESWAHDSYACTYDTSGIDWSTAESLMAANAGLLRPEASRNPKVWEADVVTCDSFLFDAVGNPFGLETYDDGHALVEEMDCAVLGLVAGDLGPSMPQFTSLRSVSDPQMPHMPTVDAEKQLASKVYDRYGYAAQVATLCAVGSLIAGYNPRKDPA